MLSKKSLILTLTALAGIGYGCYNAFFVKNNEIILNGNVEVQDVKVAFRVSGRIDKVNFDEGDSIKNGDIIATLYKDTFESKKRYSKASLDEAQTNFKNAEKNFKRNSDLFKKNSISEKTYDESKTNYEAAIAKLESAKAALEYTSIEYEDTDLKSPIDGVILTRNIEPGEMISSGTTVFTIMPNKQHKIKTFAPEDVLSKIKVGDKVKVNIETMHNKKFKGHIAFISSEAEFTPKNIETKELRTSLMYRIRVLIDEPAPELKQGMPVTVRYDQ